MISTKRKRRDSSTSRTRAAVLAATLCTAALALAAAGCGGSPGSGVAQIGSTTSKSSATGGSSPAGSSANPLAYSRCMRSHGVANFPDPDSQGRILITSGVSNGKKTGVDVNSPQFKTAQKACQSLQPNGGRPSAAQQASAQQAMLKFAQCMRAHGVPSFPDPEPGKPITLGKKAGVDVNSPAFKSAEQTCQKLVPDSPLGGGPAKAPGTP